MEVSSPFCLDPEIVTESLSCTGSDTKFCGARVNEQSETNLLLAFKGLEVSPLQTRLRGAGIRGSLVEERSPEVGPVSHSGQSAGDREQRKHL